MVVVCEEIETIKKKNKKKLYFNEIQYKINNLMRSVLKSM